MLFTLPVSGAWGPEALVKSDMHGEVGAWEATGRLEADLTGINQCRWILNKGIAVRKGEHSKQGVSPRAAAVVRHCWQPHTEEDGTEVTQAVQAATSAPVETYYA
jgi:hypothetical protein